MTATRWSIALLISCAIAISYFDRQTLSVAIAAIQRDIPLSNERFSELQAAFLIAYASMYALGGKLIDTLGTRTGFLVIMVWWSLACASHGLAGGFGALLVSRFLLGMGEGGAFPAATKAVAEWFSESQRSFAMGIINAGTAVGAVIAPPGIALVLAYESWRWVFFISGTLGLLWTLWWWSGYPGTSGPAPQNSASGADLRWHQLLAFRQTWGLMGAKFLSDSAWYFYLFWLPKYLYDARGFNIKTVGYFAWIPYAAAGVGCLVGGWLSGRLLGRGHSLNMARKVALGLSAAVMPSVILVTHAPIAFAIVLFSIAFFGQQSWSTLIMVLPADLFPGNVVASVAGLVGCGGAIGGGVFGLLVGYLLDHGYGYGTVFNVVGTLHILAFLLILVTVGDVRPIKILERQTQTA